MAEKEKKPKNKIKISDYLRSKNANKSGGEGARIKTTVYKGFKL